MSKEREILKHKDATDEKQKCEILDEAAKLNPKDLIINAVVNSLQMKGKGKGMNCTAGEKPSSMMTTGKGRFKVDHIETFENYIIQGAVKPVLTEEKNAVSSKSGGLLF